MFRLDGMATLCKVDVRLYTDVAQPLLVAARIYQGQTTNFRTPDGGFARVLIPTAIVFDSLGIPKVFDI